MIVLRMGDIRNMREPLTRLLDKEIPIKSAWKLTKLVKLFDTELTDLEEMRIQMVQKIGVEDENGNIKVPEDKMNEFIESFNEILMSDISIDFDPIPIELFGDVQVTATDMMALEKIIIMD